MPGLATIYIETVVSRLKYYKNLADKTFAQLNDEELNFQANESSNSIAIIIQHLAGNMKSRWTNFLTEDGEKPWRQREEEFATQYYTRSQLLTLWEDGWNCFLTAITPLTANELQQTIRIRNEPLIVMDAINRQLAHYPHHIGQILFLGKLIKGDVWQNLSIPKGGTDAYNNSSDIKDQAKNFR